MGSQRPDAVFSAHFSIDRSIVNRGSRSLTVFAICKLADASEVILSSEQK
jgi:hypothetical protein